jgi:hypothetical protein
MRRSICGEKAGGHDSEAEAASSAETPHCEPASLGQARTEGAGDVQRKFNKPAAL